MRSERRSASTTSRPGSRRSSAWRSGSAPRRLAKIAAMAATQALVSEGVLRSLNPATLEEVGAVPATAPEEVPELVAEAREAQERWRRTDLQERSRLLERVVERLLAHADGIALTVTGETGKPLLESYAHDLFSAADHATWLAQNAPRVLARERLRTPQPHLQHKRGYLNYEPLGVVGVISPWNFPFALPFGQVVTAVAAGNGVVLKPSELSPLSAVWIERLFEESEAPHGLVRVAHGDGEVGSALVTAPGVAKVFFTGSSRGGAEVAAAAGALLRPGTLELGGKDPMLVFEEADLDDAAPRAAWASFVNCGQGCSSVERIYVAAELHDRFVDALAERARALRV